MSEHTQVNRRDLFKGAAIGTLGGTLGLLAARSAYAQQATEIAVIVRGNRCELERDSRRGKSGAEKVFGKNFDRDGDVLHLPGHVGVACFRGNWGAQFSVFDRGEKNNRKQAIFGCRYHIPTPQIDAGRTLRLTGAEVHWQDMRNRLTDGHIRIRDLEFSTLTDTISVPNAPDPQPPVERFNADDEVHIVRRATGAAIDGPLDVVVTMEATKAINDLFQIRALRVHFEVS